MAIPGAATRVRGRSASRMSPDGTTWIGSRPVDHGRLGSLVTGCERFQVPWPLAGGEPRSRAIASCSVGTTEFGGDFPWRMLAQQSRVLKSPSCAIRGRDDMAGGNVFGRIAPRPVAGALKGWTHHAIRLGRHARPLVGSLRNHAAERFRRGIHHHHRRHLPHPRGRWQPRRLGMGTGRPWATRGWGNQHRPRVTATTIGAGGIHTLTLDGDRNAWTRGNDDEGNLGNGAADTNESTPMQLLMPQDLHPHHELVPPRLRVASVQIPSPTPGDASRSSLRGLPARGSPCRDPPIRRLPIASTTSSRRGQPRPNDQARAISHGRHRLHWQARVHAPRAEKRRHRRSELHWVEWNAITWNASFLPMLLQWRLAETTRRSRACWRSSVRSG